MVSVLIPTDSYSALNTYVSAFNTNGFNLGAGTYDSNKSRREKYESLLNMAKERHEVETALTHARFMNPLLAKTMKSREESSTSELKNIAKRKQIAAKVDEYSKNIEAERRKRLVRARAFNIAKLRNK